eukprot:228791-Pyramimonas_sp.AAC.1
MLQLRLARKKRPKSAPGPAATRAGRRAAACKRAAIANFIGCKGLLLISWLRTLQQCQMTAPLC